MVAINKIDLASGKSRPREDPAPGTGPPRRKIGVATSSAVRSAPPRALVWISFSRLISLQSEVLELKADPKTTARGTVIEAQIEQGRGPTATLIVRMGTLRVGDAFICGNHWGKVKQLINDLGKPVKEAGPATPVKVLGLSGMPNAGDELVEMDNERDARTLSEERLEGLRTNKLAAPQRDTLENLFANIAEGQKAVASDHPQGRCSGFG